MRISDKRKEELYAAIHMSVVDVRIKLNLPPKDDFTLAQIENKIWEKQKLALGID